MVAQEVKSLAHQTATATAHIARQVTDIRNATAEAVEGSGHLRDDRGYQRSVGQHIGGGGRARRRHSRDRPRIEQAAGGTQEVSVNIADVQQVANDTGTASGQVLDLSWRAG